MNKTIYILSLLLLSFLFSCSDDEGAYFPKPSEFSISSTEFTVDREGGDLEFTIKAGNLGWSITSEQNWVSISDKFGSGDSTVKLSIVENQTGAERTATVVVKPTFDLEPITITVKQN